MGVSRRTAHEKSPRSMYRERALAAKSRQSSRSNWIGQGKIDRDEIDRDEVDRDKVDEDWIELPLL
jgi:hypothetical protein